MPSNSSLHLITKLINFDGFKATNYDFITDNEILITLESNTLKFCCPHCHTITNKIHQNHYYRIRDIAFGTYDVFLNVNRRQFKCSNCHSIFVEEVSIDLWIGYKNLILELMPNAQIVADRFHVMKQINEELDAMRKKQKREAEKIKNKGEREEKLEGLKNSKYPLLKKKENLNEAEKEKLEEVKKVTPELIKAYEEKEGWREIFESEITGDEALDKIAEWIKSAQKYLPKSCGMIRRWLDEILAYFDKRTSQGIVEGINQKIKLIKRRAYGMTNFDNFQRRILLNWAVS